MTPSEFFLLRNNSKMSNLRFYVVFFSQDFYWDPENDLFEPEIQPNSPKNCQFPALLRTLKFPKCSALGQLMDYCSDFVYIVLVCA